MSRSAILQWIMMLLLLVPISAATSLYPNIGGRDYDFDMGRGDFSLVEDPILNGAGFNDLKGSVVFNDADHDNNTDFHVIDSDNYKVVEGTDLTFRASFDFGAEERYSHPILYDIDDNGFENFIFSAEQSQAIYIYEYNGTAINNISLISYAGLASSNGGETMVMCRAVNDCLLVYSEEFGSCSGSNNCNDLSAVTFNSTALTSSRTLLSQTGNVNANGDGSFCRSDVPAFTISDYDADGTDEYIFSFGEFTETSSLNDGAVHVFYMNGNTEEIEIDQDVDAIDSDTPLVTGLTSWNCDSVNTNSFTSPLLSTDFTNDAGMETVIAFQTTDEEFVIYLYKSDGTFIDDFPETDNSNGNIIGNPFIARPFPEVSTGEAFCVVGFNQQLSSILGDEKQIITCGSKSKSGLETAEYTYEFPTDVYNITEIYDIANTAAHSTQQSSALTNGVDLDEVLTPYGIYTLDDSTCSPSVILGKDICASSQIYYNENGEGFTVPVEGDITPLEDFILMKETSMFYVDDGLGNRPIKDLDVLYNPCVTDTQIQINTTFRIQVTPTDGNSDVGLANDAILVTTIIYKDTANEQIANTTVPSGSVATFTFTPNVTGTNQKIAIRADDNNTEPVEIEQLFSIATNGLEFGDSTCSVDYLGADTTSAAQNGTITDSEGNVIDDNEINKGLSALSGLIGVSAGLIWIILMIGIGISIIVGNSYADTKFSATQIVSLTFLMEGFMIVLGAFLGLLGVGLVVTLSILVLGGLAIWFGRMFVPSGA